VKHANRVPKVLQQILDEGKTLLGMVVLPYRFSRSKLQRRLASRLCPRHAGAQIFVSLKRKMVGDLVMQALVVTMPCGEI
jgi:hypothetical protein